MKTATITLNTFLLLIATTTAAPATLVPKQLDGLGSLGGILGGLLPLLGLSEDEGNELTETKQARSSTEIVPKALIPLSGLQPVTDGLGLTGSTGLLGALGLSKGEELTETTEILPRQMDSCVSLLESLGLESLSELCTLLPMSEMCSLLDGLDLGAELGSICPSGSTVPTGSSPVPLPLPSGSGSTPPTLPIPGLSVSNPTETGTALPPTLPVLPGLPNLSLPNAELPTIPGLPTLSGVSTEGH